MTDTEHHTALIEKLRQYDTPTICNAIEIAQGGRGFDAFTKRTMHSSDPAGPPIVGFARTARLRSNTPPTAPLDAVKALRMQYFEYMADEPRASIAVVEDLDGDAAQGAWWGEIHTAVHKGIGLCGALTNGLMRDLGDLEPGFPVIAGGVGPSHAFIHVVDFGQPIEVFRAEDCTRRFGACRFARRGGGSTRAVRHSPRCHRQTAGAGNLHSRPSARAGF